MQQAENEYIIEKGAVDVLDYIIDFTEWLGTDTITTVTSNPTRGGVIVQSVGRNTAEVIDNGNTIAPNKAVILWLYGGSPGSMAKVRVSASTTAGRVKSIMIVVKITD